MNSKITDKIKVLKTVNLILSGHMHNGLVPHWLEDYVNYLLKMLGDDYYKNRGLISPTSELFPKLSRGIVEINGKWGIIGSPVTTISEEKRLLSRIANSSLVLPPTMTKIKMLRK